MLNIFWGKKNIFIAPADIISEKVKRTRNFSSFHVFPSSFSLVVSSLRAAIIMALFLSPEAGEGRWLHSLCRDVDVHWSPPPPQPHAIYNVVKSEAASFSFPH
jgi:hypothetical protein